MKAAWQDNGLCVGGAEDASEAPVRKLKGTVEETGTELQSAREDIAAALRRRSELDAELVHLHAEVVAARAGLADAQAYQTPTEVLKLRQEIRRMKAALPARAGETR